MDSVKPSLSIVARSMSVGIDILLFSSHASVTFDCISDVFMFYYGFIEKIIIILIEHRIIVHEISYMKLGKTVTET